MGHPFEAFIGKSSTPVRNEVEKGAIRKFAEAIGDSNPQYRGEAPDGVIVAPPTFSRTFDYGKIPGFTLPVAGLIHGEQSFEYFRPIRAGDVFYCSQKLTAVTERTGKLGKMVFLVFENTAADEDVSPVVREHLTVIYREQGGDQ